MQKIKSSAKKRPRIIFEIDDKKLRDDMKKAARKNRMTLKYAVITAFEKFVQESLDLQ